MFEEIKDDVQDLIDDSLMAGGDFGDGTQAAPSITFASDPDTGIYRDAAETVAITTSGTKKLLVSTTAVTSTLPILTGDGNGATPAYAFSSDASNGMYLAAADDVGISAGGTGRLRVSTTAVTSTLPIVIPVGSSTAPSLAFSGDTDNGIYRVGANIIGFASNSGSNVATFGAGGFTSSSVFIGPTGSVTAPTYTFTGDADTGMYRTGADSIGFTTAGSASARLTIDTSKVTSTLPVVVPLGSASAASLQFAGDPNTGIFSDAPDVLSFCSASVPYMTMTGGTIATTVQLTAPAAGGAATPVYTFTGDTDTGIYRATSNTVGIAAGGVEVAQFDQNGLDVTGYSFNAEQESFVDAGKVDAYTFKKVAPTVSQTGNTTLEAVGSPTISSTVTDTESSVLSYAATVTSANYYRNTAIHATTAAIFTAQTVSISFWLYTNDYPSANRGILSYAVSASSAPTTGSYHIYRGSTNLLNVTVRDSTSTEILRYIETTAPPVDTWVHYAFTFKAGSNLFYRDGLLLPNGSGRTDVIGTTATTVPSITPTNMSFGFTASSVAINERVDGSFKDLTVSSTEWTAQQVRSNRAIGIKVPQTTIHGQMMAYGGVRRNVVGLSGRTTYFTKPSDEFLSCTATVTDVYLHDSNKAGDSIVIANSTGGSITVRAQGTDILTLAGATTYTLLTGTAIRCEAGSIGRWYIYLSV